MISFYFCEQHDRWDNVDTLKNCKKCHFGRDEGKLTKKERNKLYKGLELDD